MIGSIRNLKCGFMTLKNSLEFNKTWLAEHNNIFWNLFTFYEKWSVLRILCNLIFQKGVILKYDKSRFQLRALTLILTISLNTVLKFRGQTQTHKYHHIGAILVTRGAVIPSLLVDTCQGRVANVAPLSRCWPGCDAQLQGLWVGGLVTSVNISQLTREPELPFTAPDGNCGLRPCSLFPAHCSMTDTMRSWRYEEHSPFLNSNIPEQNFREFYFSESDHSILLNEPLRISADWQWVHWPRLTAWSSGYPHKNTRTQGSHVPTPGTGPGHLLAFTNITILWRVTSSWE